MRAYLIEPFKQVKFGFYVVAVCFIYAVLIGIFFVRAFYEQYLQVAEIFQVAENMEILDNSVFWRNGFIAAVLLLAFIGTTLAVVIKRTHRMYGPMVNIIGFIDRLKQGDFTARVRLRQADDFQEVANHLNSLAEDLEQDRIPKRESDSA